ncbi:hypothetical protein LTR84_008286 [Exophiala bonariae]|uniref:Zn(2)-C6 fungal-type domain-containing protein n=1 Tax=Exophiala bonariae TaxID=1690606 RepID=A0AAV9N1F1_9EURO|nr:hypothetical protein LTR84_008286 [Exophiala bonariae]
MDRSLSSRDQSTDRPNDTFPSTTSSQFTHSQYPLYPPPIDAELTMSSNYPAMPQSYTQQLHDASNDDKMDASPSQNTFAVNTNGAGNGVATDPAMAPPQTPNAQALVTTASRSMVEDPSDTPMTGDKRKRSKVSRACDECRRKKVRCINPPSEDDENDGGVPKTCTNCEKAGTVCGFERKPMKRGPSKGYIKDLADRVHSVEQLQAAHLRQSLDIGSTSVPFDQVAFSPEETPTSRTRYSFSNAQTPFAQSEFQRDRIPSTGAWGSNLPDLRSRDRGSLAIAPDQTLPPSGNAPDSDLGKNNAVYTDKSFWSDLDEARPAKRQKTDDSPDNMESFDLNEAHLSQYYNHIHPLVGLLPEAKTVIRVIENATVKVSHAFVTALELLPGVPSGPTVNGDHNQDSTTLSQTSVTTTKTSFKSSAFSSFDEFSKWLSAKLKDHPADRSDDDNLALVWTCLLVGLALENDFNGMISDPLLTADFLSQTFEVVSYLVADTRTPAESSITDNEDFLGVVQTAYNVNFLLATTHALGSGLKPYLKADRKLSSVNKTTYVSPEAAYVTLFSNTVEMILPFMEISHESLGFYPFKWLKGAVLYGLAHYPTLDEKSAIVRQINAFLAVVVLRNKKDIATEELFMTTNFLGNFMAQKGRDTSESSPYNPIDVHCYALATITLLEITLTSGNPFSRTGSKETIEELEPILQGISATYHKHHAGIEWFYAPENGANDGYTTTHWSDCLLGAIKHARANEPSEYEWSPDDRIVPAFDRLLRRGYLNVLSLFPAQSD